MWQPAPVRPVNGTSSQSSITPERSCLSCPLAGCEFWEKAEATTLTGFTLKHLGGFWVCKQCCSAFSFLFSLLQLRKVPTLLPGQSLVSQHKRSINHTVSAVPAVHKEMLSYQINFCKIIVLFRKGTLHNISTPQLTPAPLLWVSLLWTLLGKRWGPSMDQLVTFPTHTLVCTMQGLCVRISWIRLNTLKFTGTIWREREKTKWF